MALAFPTPGHRLASERLHYFKPFRALISLAVILAGGSALVRWGWFVARSGQTVLESAILTFILLFLVTRIFLPRTLTVDGREIRWTIRWRPPSRTAPVSAVRAIQFLTTTGPGRQRYYFVNGEGEALLWVDRFTLAEMLAFANYLGVPIRPVATVPAVPGETRAVDQRWRAIARKRAQVATFVVVGLLGLAMSIFLAVVAVQSIATWSAYQRAGTCSQPPNDPLACRLETQATVTKIDPRGKSVWELVHLQFSQDVLAAGDHRSTSVWFDATSQAAASVVVGQTASVEIFDRSYVTALNGTRLHDYDLMKSNAAWWYALVPLFIPVVMGFFAYGSWKSDVSSFERDDDEPKPAKKATRWPGWRRPIGAFSSRLWIAWVG